MATRKFPRTTGKVAGMYFLKAGIFIRKKHKPNRKKKNNTKPQQKTGRPSGRGFSGLGFPGETARKDCTGDQGNQPQEKTPPGPRGAKGGKKQQETGLPPSQAGGDHPTPPLTRLRLTGGECM